jgi:deoxycytidine triphosphate deaminase
MAAEDAIVGPLVRRIADELSNEIGALPLPRFAIDAESMTRLESRLQRGLPVGAQGTDRRELTAALSEYRRRQGDERHTTRRDYDNLVKRFDEQPTTVPAIVLSGHGHRIRLLNEEARNLATIDAARLSRLCARLDTADELVRTSIDSSAVHSRLFEEAHRAADPPLESEHLDTIIAPSGEDEETSPLSDIQILTRLVAEDDSRTIFVSPLISARAQVGPASLDVRLGTDVHVTSTSSLSDVNLERPAAEIAEQMKQYFRRVRLGAEGFFVLHPGHFVLASTLEYFRLPRDIAGRLEGRSSLARLGLQVHDRWVR